MDLMINGKLDPSASSSPFYEKFPVIELLSFATAFSRLVDSWFRKRFG